MLIASHPLDRIVCHSPWIVSRLDLSDIMVIIKESVKTARVNIGAVGDVYVLQMLQVHDYLLEGSV